MVAWGYEILRGLFDGSASGLRGIIQYTLEFICQWCKDMCMAGPTPSLPSGELTITSKRNFGHPHSHIPFIGGASLRA
jgi:hypothetical protein